MRDVLLDTMDPLYRYILARVAWDSHAGEDVLQQTVVAAMESDRAPAAPDELRAWLRGVASNLCKRHWRTNARARSTIERSITNGPRVLERLESDCPHQVMQDDELREALLTAIAELADDDQRILYAFYRHGCSHTELADEIGGSPKSVEMRLYRARARLRDQLTTPGGAGTAQEDAP